MLKRKITYILSDIDKAYAFEWISSKLDKQRFDLSFILLNDGDSFLEQYLLSHKVPVQRIRCRGKKDWIMAWIKTFLLLVRQRPHTVHCHLIQANIIGLSAAWFARIPQRVYTRHHSVLHHVYHPKGVWWDKFTNSLSTNIVAITEVVKEVLVSKEGVSPSKISLIHHGFDLDLFYSVESNRVEALRQKYNLPANKKIIGVIARYTHWKGIQYIIPAFARLRQEYPDLHLVLANARGDYKKEIQGLLSELPADAYTEIDFETDLPALYRVLDYYVHVPISRELEAFGQTYIEALASGIPSVFTLSGIANEFIVDGKNALVVPFENSEAIYFALAKLIKDKSLCENLKLQGRDSVSKAFSLPMMMNKLEELYAR